MPRGIDGQAAPGSLTTSYCPWLLQRIEGICPLHAPFSKKVAESSPPKPCMAVFLTIAVIPVTSKILPQEQSSPPPPQHTSRGGFWRELYLKSLANRPNRWYYRHFKSLPLHPCNRIHCFYFTSQRFHQLVF